MGSHLPEGLLFQVTHVRPRNVNNQAPSTARLKVTSLLARHPAQAKAPTRSWSSVPLDRGTTVSFAEVLHMCTGQGWSRCNEFSLISSSADLATSNAFG